MKNKKISAKLMISFSILLFMITFIGIIAAMAINAMNENTNKMYNDNFKSISFLQTISMDYHKENTCLRDLLLYDNNSEFFNSSKTTLETAKNSLTNALAELDKVVVIQEEQLLLDELVKSYNTYVNNIITPVVQFAENSQNQQAMDLISANISLIASIDSLIGEMVVYNEDAAAYAMVYNQTSFETIFVVFAIILLIAVIITIRLVFYLTKQIAKPMVCLSEYVKVIGEKGSFKTDKNISENLKAYAAVKDEIGTSINAVTDMIEHLKYISSQLSVVADGDLSVKINLASDDDEMGNALYGMVKNLNSMFSIINDSSDQVNSGAQQVSNASQALSHGTTEQASAIEQLSASIAQIHSQVNKNAQDSSNADNLSEQALINVGKCGGSMKNMLDAMAEINNSSVQISKIIKVIEDIAFQTNILALNAAVEAARAGEAGKGFAVVADEVRALAGKSAEAANQTTMLIENSVQSVKNGMQIAQSTAQELEEVAEKTKGVSQIISAISKSSTEQAQAINQINMGIDQISSVVQTNAATAEQSAAASEELTSQADVLKYEINKFKL